MSRYEAVGVPDDEPHPGKPDEGAKPGGEIRSEGGRRYYVGTNENTTYYQERATMRPLSILELSATLYNTKNASEGCILQYQKAASLFAQQLIVRSNSVRKIHNCALLLAIC